MTAATDIATPQAAPAAGKPHLDHPMDIRLALGILAVLAGGLFYMAYSISRDIAESGGGPTTILPFVLLGVALLIALGFEFVNGFHDTANAVATVIYTHALPAQFAVVWSGCWNLIGVLASSGAVAFGIVSLLPVELIMQVGSSAGYAMVFALLIAAIIWNLGTWLFGIPASSSHTLIGSIVGVGVTNALLRGQDGTAGVDWDQVTKIGEALLFSPLFGFALSALLLLLMKAIVRVPALYKAPEGRNPPPTWIRGLLILTCTLVSFFHGSNDGQKGMGLIMLILIGVAPTAYALNHAPPAGHAESFIAAAQAASKVVAAHGAGYDVIGDPRPAVTEYVHAHKISEGTYPSLAVLVRQISDQVKDYGSVARTPLDKVQNVRNDMYLASEALRVLSKDKESELTADDKKEIGEFKKQLDFSTKFIPIWVKICVAIALGLGTMVGWKRIVVTVGEKIGKTHLTYGQGAAAELVAAATIGAADGFGLPVSTTHVLSSGVAGTMVANGSGMQWSTVGSIALAWVLTLPAAMLLSGTLFFIFRQIF
ncbi:PiT family inorganic phosphate transporter [Roseiarcus fermentans]|uniref:Phosphate transporter n=1 Tax=Roseiarcus fermentans TaxID=1473586 RepID=A0A366EPD6_9HYPH|nr:inorganic phosphate transporter [Roseiarcus fermentans]RBP03550.1 PiT family inorganic phosphate transporter [Roseiarcus fermentans]